MKQKDNSDILLPIWNSKGFKNGNDFFYLANYEFFRIVNKEEFQRFNSLSNRYYKINKEKFQNKVIIGIADYTSGDREEVYLMLSDYTKEVYIYPVRNNNKLKRKDDRLIYYTNSLESLFECKKNCEEYIKGNKDELWRWYEMCFHSSTFEKEVPVGVYPSFDLRHYFVNLKGTFISNHEEFDRTGFENYFKTYDLENIIPEDFVAFKSYDRNLKNLIDKINNNSEKNKFVIVSFNPSGYWGICNIKELKEIDFNRFQSYGLIGEIEF